MVQAPGTERCLPSSSTGSFPSSPQFTPLLSFVSSFRLHAGNSPNVHRSLARTEFFMKTPGIQPDRAVRNCQTFNFALLETSPSPCFVASKPLHHPGSSPLRRGVAISRSRYACTLARHNYYLLDTHHWLIPRVFQGRNRYRLMTERAPHPLHRGGEGGNYLRYSGVHHPIPPRETAGPRSSICSTIEPLICTPFPPLIR